MTMLLLPYVVVAGVFGAVEYVLEMVPSFIYSMVAFPFLGVANAAVRAILVPGALLLVFYLLAERTDADLWTSRVPLWLAVFVGTLIVFIPIDVGQAAFSATLPGFTTSQALVIYFGDAISSSLNHSFIGISGVLLWQVLARPKTAEAYSKPRGSLHGTEDVSVVGVALVGIYSWQYLAQAYQATYLVSGTKNVVAVFFASLLGGGSSEYFTLAGYQQIILLMLVPFLLFFLLARGEGLNPYVQGRKIAAVIFAWALFIRFFAPYFYVYFEQLFDPAALAGQTIVSTVASELAPANLIGIVASSCTFTLLGMAATVFGFFARNDRLAKAQGHQPPPGPLPQ